MMGTDGVRSLHRRTHYTFAIPVELDGTPEDILRVHAQNAGRWKMCRDDKARMNAAVRARQ